MKIIRLALALLSLIMTGCDALGAIAPPPAPTAAPTDTPIPAPTSTATPTLGPREHLDAVFCWPSPIDTGSFNLLRFFTDGTVLDAGVAPFADCAEAWNQMKQYLTIENTQTFNHGEYFLSGETIRFELAAARSNKIIGEVTGVYLGDKMILSKAGAENLEYTLVQP
ncbi:MAG TPA: hypothetical protein VJL59_15905 [Anaerolineales bacterium]|nr:hypothetical protein [Anaerolineales bacterium]